MVAAYSIQNDASELLALMYDASEDEQKAFMQELHDRGYLRFGSVADTKNIVHYMSVPVEVLAKDLSLHVNSVPKTMRTCEYEKLLSDWNRLLFQNGRGCMSLAQKTYRLLCRCLVRSQRVVGNSFVDKG